MATKKLTESQRKVLTLLDQHSRGSYFDVCKVGGNGQTLFHLTAHQLLEMTEVNTVKTWSITEAGRNALKADRYTV